ncbi:MAG: hypothetical protein HY869_01115 [Chloroflexi bacterium]|nr:hypothetical protein [Chloroflexota bacterium]
MEFFLPEDNLNRMTPAETKITALGAFPYSDGRRLRVNIEMTPFQQRPHLEITLVNADGREVASVSVVEPMSWKLELTLHIRGELRSPYTLTASLFYPDGPAADPLAIPIEVDPPPAEDTPVDA